MVNKKSFLIFLGLICVCITLYFFIFETQEAKIKKQFKSIEKSINKQDGENPIISATKVNKIKKTIADQCRIDAPYYSLSKPITPDELSSYIFNGRSYYSEISIKFYDFIMDFQDENRVLLDLTADIKGKLKAGEMVEDIHEFRCELIKKQDTWLFTEIEIVEVLKK